jgi:hypothetical protein
MNRYFYRICFADISFSVSQKTRDSFLEGDHQEKKVVFDWRNFITCNPSRYLNFSGGGGRAEMEPVPVWISDRPVDRSLPLDRPVY